MNFFFIPYTNPESSKMVIPPSTGKPGGGTGGGGSGGLCIDKDGNTNTDTSIITNTSDAKIL